MPSWLGELVHGIRAVRRTRLVASFACRRFRYTLVENNDFPWLGIIIASPIIGIWYWCTDQYIVQRTLAAKNLTLALGADHLGSSSQSLAGSHLSITRDHWLGFTSKRNSSYSDEISGQYCNGYRWRSGLCHDGDSTLGCWVTRSSSRWLISGINEFALLAL